MTTLNKTELSQVNGGMTHPAETEMKGMIQVLKDYFGL
jgi:bacteriocin-like protein